MSQKKAFMILHQSFTWLNTDANNVGKNSFGNKKPNRIIG